MGGTVSTIIVATAARLHHRAATMRETAAREDDRHAETVR